MRREAVPRPSCAAGLRASRPSPGGAAGGRGSGRAACGPAAGGPERDIDDEDEKSPRSGGQGPPEEKGVMRRKVSGASSVGEGGRERLRSDCGATAERFLRKRFRGGSVGGAIGYASRHGRRDPNRSGTASDWAHVMEGSSRFRVPGSRLGSGGRGRRRRAWLCRNLKPETWNLEPATWNPEPAAAGSRPSWFDSAGRGGYNAGDSWRTAEESLRGEAGRLPR